ncbi:MAG: DUF4446 family protein [Lachnospiraceae bacterium]|nr:DUF4446 family protein [Lachnospiraceae bacterium]
MSSIFDMIGIDPGYIIIGLIVLVIALIVLCIILLVNVKKLDKRYKKFMQGKNGDELEQVIYERFAELDIMQQIATQHALEIKNLKRQFRSSYSKIGIVKYDAFKEMGGTLSFVLAMLNDRNNGFLMNCMHSREGCYTYVKEIINGESYIALSEEEKEALKNAINMKDAFAE